MTAINAFVRPDAVHLLTDTATAAPDGLVNSVSYRKVATYPHLGAAIVASTAAGSGFLGPRLCFSLEEFTCQAEMLDGFIAKAKRAVRITRQDGLIGESALAYVVLAVWNAERQAAETYSFVTEDTPFFERPAWDAARATCPNISCSPWNEVTEAELRGRGVRLGPLTRPADVALDLMNAQRRSCPNTIGGYLTETIISASGIAQRALHRWPERVGQPWTSE